MTLTAQRRLPYAEDGAAGATHRRLLHGMLLGPSVVAQLLLLTSCCQLVRWLASYSVVLTCCCLPGCRRRTMCGTI